MSSPPILLLDKGTNYTVIMAGFQCLYNNLTTIDSTSLLTTNKVLTFVNDDIFHQSLPEACLLEILKHNIQEFAPYITDFIKMAMTMFAEGLSHQKSAIFWVWTRDY